MPRLVQFDEFQLDLSTGDLHRNGRKTHLPEQQFQLLEILLRAQGDLVSREEIRKRLWPNDTIVEFDRSINAAIKKLRAALNDSADTPRLIETVTRRGYRILVSVQFPEIAPIPAPGNREVDGSLVGQRVAHYRVLELLGGGGMGLVYKAEDLKLNRLVALKFLPEELRSDFSALRRFEREARTASSLNHPNICTIYGVEDSETHPFIAMELLEGQTLRELISTRAGENGNPLSIERILEIGIQIADGLDAAHQKGIIHRDIKPANVFVTGRRQVKILDFGLAKLASAEPEIPSPIVKQDLDLVAQTVSPVDPGYSLSRPGMAMGTAGYMSPEQVRGEPLDNRSDLYSFGLILFEMATGRRAFYGDSAEIVHNAILHQELPLARQLSSEVPVELEEIIRKALEKDRDSRFQNAAAMLTELKGCQEAINPTQKADFFGSSAQDRPAFQAAKFSTWSFRTKMLISGIFLLAAALGLLGWKYSQRPLAGVSERQLTNTTNIDPVNGAAISWDGKYLAFGDNLGVHVQSLETGETHDISNPSEIQELHVSWTICWFPNSTRFFAVSTPPVLVVGNSPGHRTITWEGSVLSGTLIKLRDDLNTQSVSPDGSLIAAFKPNERDPLTMRELWVMDTNGGNAHKLFDSGDRSEFWVAHWSPDGRKLLYLLSEPNARSLGVLDVASGDHHTLLTNQLIGNDIFWLRDGRILYMEMSKGCDYWVARIDERTNEFAEKPKELIQNRGFCVGDTTATADSKKLVFTRRTYGSAVYVADVERGGTRITPPRPLTMGASEEMPSGWTADSSEVVFTSSRDGKGGIYRQPLRGGPVQPIYIPNDANSRFDGASTSPDGHWLLITREPQGGTQTGRMDLYRIPIEGGKEELMARNIDGFSCAATPKLLCELAKKENNALVFTSFPPEQKEGSELGRFTPMDPKVDYGGILSPDGTQIAITAGRTGQIYLLNLKTHQTRRFLIKGWTNLWVDAWTADGRGLFLSCFNPDGVLLHSDLHGNVDVLWETHDTRILWSMPSADGKHIAMPHALSDVNVWMLENF